MINKGLLFFSLILGLVACQHQADFESTNTFSSFFYPLDSIPKVYVYRDISNGLDEQFHRVYAVKDDAGQHIVVETYTADGRIIEALNYNTDSLDIMDHMVVDRTGKKQKAELFKYKLIPNDRQDEIWFASRFPGFLDSTLILKEIKRKFSREMKTEVLEETKPTVVFSDHIRMTNFNPFTKKETVLEGNSLTCFTQGIGLSEWYTPDKKVHFKLEKILSQEEWIKLVTR